MTDIIDAIDDVANEFATGDPTEDRLTHVMCISNEVKSMLAHFYIKKLDPETSKSQAMDWLVALVPYGLDAIHKARTTWITKKSRAPTIAEFLQNVRDAKQDIIHSSLYDELRSKVEQCESPIERMLFLALMPIKEGFDIYTQYDVPPYRIDIVIITESPIRVAIECDGYDYHSSPEQIERDHKRDRAIQKLGYFVLRFTGSEINRNPAKCASEVWRFVKTLSRYG